MLKDCIEPYYLTQDYNCAETTLHIIDDQYGLGLAEEEFKLVGGFGAGFGCGITCGALAGGVAALGRLAITGRAHVTEGFRDLCADYCAAFEKALGAPIAAASRKSTSPGRRPAVSPPSRPPPIALRTLPGSGASPKKSGKVPTDRHWKRSVL